VSSFHVGCNSCYWQIMFIVPEKINESALKRRGFKPFFRFDKNVVFNDLCITAIKTIPCYG
ncbi:MAG: hypothetical protein WA896_07135, partial [Spirulinaceae cyanobacterium]